MKNCNFKYLATIAFSIYSMLTFSQNWRVGGNTTAQLGGNPPDIGTTQNNPLNVKTVQAQPINFLTGNSQRMIISGTTGFVGIGVNNYFATNSPLTMLHIEGVNATPGTTAWRNWMKTGVFMKENSDNMYVGVKTIAPDISYAIINWGDNNGGVGAVDLLSFNFTGVGAGGLESSVNGMETMRVTPNPEKGTLGVGNFQNIGIYKEPVRRVEILDASPVTGINQDAPQLRLTYKYDDNVAQGIFSEFQVTSNGDLYLNTRRSALPQNFGFHKSNPQNCVEINSHAGNTGFQSINGSSGLRFTNMTSASTPQTNPGTGVLSVDANGDVIYVPKTQSGVGNYCGATSNPIINNPYEIPMNGFNYNFTNPVNSQSSIHIGNPTCSPTIGRLNVYNDNLQIGGVFSSNLNTATNSFGIYSTITNAGSGDAIGIHAVANTSGAGNIARGLRGEGIAANGLIAQGVKGTANTNNNCAQNIAVGGLSANGSVISISGDFDVEQSNSPTNQGVNVEVINGTNSSATNVGINVSANSIGSSNFGGIFVANGATNNYAVFAQAPITAVQTPGSTPSLNGNYAGYFNGDVVRTGTDNFTSDQMLKQNIDSISNAMTIINQLKPKSYDYKISSFPSMHLPSGKQYGLIAQDVQSVLPELVNNNTHPAELDSVGNIVTPSFNYLSLEYQQLIAIMLKGMQEQQQKIDSLTTKLNTKDSLQDARLTALENMLNQCCANASARNGNSNINQLDIELSDKDAIVLNQNVPNPFAEQTTITYNVPTSVEKAQLIFFNSNGQVIQTVDIKTRGKGKVNVFAADLSSGLYHYSLVADGKVVDSKKMVRE